MKTFWDLPKPVREKIYRLHLVADEQPVDFTAYKKTCGYTEDVGDADHDVGKPARLQCPDLLQVSRKMEREASLVYFGENSFQLSRPEGLSVWKRFTAPRHIKQMRKVALSGWTELRGSSADAAFKALNTLPKLESLTFCLEEEETLKTKLMHSDFRTQNRPISWHPRLGFGPQVNLQLLRLRGMDGLRSLRGLREVKLVKDLGVSSDDLSNVGLMSGGFFETVIMKEIMQPRFPKKAPCEDHAPFRLLDLPPELRNMIYSMLLLFPGPTYPVSGKPLSVTTRLKYKSRPGREALPIPWSALEVLCINKQVYDEAHKLFCQNDLVFSDPTVMQDFMCSLSDARLDCLRSLTLFCEVSTETAPRSNTVTKTGLGGTLLLIRRLKGLRKLHLLLRFRPIGFQKHISTMKFIDPVDVSRLKDVKTLFTLRGVADLKFCDLDLITAGEESDRRMANRAPGLHPKYFQLAKCIARQTAALRHFNYGLQLAQTGVVVRELYTVKDWRDMETRPVLQGSDCGIRKGCSCGVSKVEPAEGIEIMDDSD